MSMNTETLTVPTQPATPEISNAETSSATKFAYLPIQLVPLANEKGEAESGFASLVHVFRYPVIDGWIVGTIVGINSRSAISQSFVHDPDHIWNPTLSEEDRTSSVAQS